MRLEDLERELRAERPEVEPEFARKLDDWAAAGFPRGGPLDPRSPKRQAESGFQAAFRRAWERLTAVPPRRLAGAAGAATLVIVIGGAGISGLSQIDGGDDDGGSEASLESAPHAGGGDGGDAGGGAEPAAPTSPQADVPTGDTDYNLSPGGAATEAAQTGRGGQAAAPTVSPGSSIAPVPPDDGGDGVARGTDERLQDATARLSLGTEADEVQEVANDVVAVTDRHDGIVLDSQVTSDQGGARASFRLEIPFTELDAALTDLSELGDVISRTEAAEDITQAFVRAQKEYARTLDRIQELRIDLIEADTREERLVLRSQIATLKAQADAYEAERNRVERRARFATVNVEITSNGPDSDDDGWSLGDAADDAGDVLRTMAGVGLVTLAVLVPVALIGALAYWITTTTRRRSRERALDS